MLSEAIVRQHVGTAWKADQAPKQSSLDDAARKSDPINGLFSEEPDLTIAGLPKGPVVSTVLAETSLPAKGKSIVSLPRGPFVALSDSS